MLQAVCFGFILFFLRSDTRITSLQLSKGIVETSNHKTQWQRRNFLASCLQASVIMNSKHVCAYTSPSETSQSETMQNYIYRKNWVGTSLPILSQDQASSRIESEKDPVIQNKLISQQNNLLSYITGLGIGVGTSDKLLLKRMKSYKR